MQKLTEYLKNVRIELAKVSWPTRQEVTAATVLVVILSIVVSLFVFACDWMLRQLLGVLL